VAEYARLLHELGFEFNLNNTASIRDSFNRLAEAARQDEALAFAEPYAVRTMAKAIYSTYNIGHWGLAFQYYAHFTSPIRRYADVLVHRILEKNLGETYRMKKHELEQICQHISNQERKAQEAERESIKYKMVEFISDHLGETFDGVVNGFIEFGFFVQLQESRVEGLVSFQTLEESFRTEDSGLAITGSRSGTRLKIGDRIRVLVKDVRLNDMEVDLIWIQ
jgi:ribonuclease R